jgi:pyruvate dehydrogenase (quinone)/pyruvate decarboxylase
MLMAELTTAVQNKLPIKVVILKNDSLAQVMFEQKEAGFGVFGAALGPVDFVAFAEACGAKAFRCRTPAELGPAIAEGFRAAGVALVEAEVDKNEPTKRPSQLGV